MKTLSKFDFGEFVFDFDGHAFAASKQRYTKAEAIKLYYSENMLEFTEAGLREDLVVEEGFVRHRPGYFEGEQYVCWWLEDEEHKRSCPVWILYEASND